MDNINDRRIPNVISLEDIELNISPPSIINPSQMETDKSDNSIFKEVSNVTEPVILNTLLFLIEKELNINSNVSLTLTADEIKVLKVIMNNAPVSLNNIEKTINSIISDNTINAADIPKFLTLIKEFHELIVDNSLNTKFSGEQLINASVSLIKFIVPIILKKSDLDNDNIIKTMNTIIDAAAQLLLFIPHIKNGKCGLFCF
jgi:hypothetical protein